MVAPGPHQAPKALLLLRRRGVPSERDRESAHAVKARPSCPARAREKRAKRQLGARRRGLRGGRRDAPGKGGLATRGESRPCSVNEQAGAQRRSRLLEQGRPMVGRSALLRSECMLASIAGGGGTALVLEEEGGRGEGRASATTKDAAEVGEEEGRGGRGVRAVRAMVVGRHEAMAWHAVSWGGCGTRTGEGTCRRWKRWWVRRGRADDEDDAEAARLRDKDDDVRQREARESTSTTRGRGDAPWTTSSVERLAVQKVGGCASSSQSPTRRRRRRGRGRTRRRRRRGGGRGRTRRRAASRPGCPRGRCARRGRRRSGARGRAGG